MAGGFLFPPEDLILSVLDLTRELERRGVIEIYTLANGAHAYRIVDDSGARQTSPPKQLKGEFAQRIGAIFRRRAKTAWSAEEIKAFRQLVIHPDDLAVVEEYYKSESKKPDNFCRTSVLTFLRYYPGEVDKALRWKANAPRRHCY